jgi:hypothetical protein
MSEVMWNALAAYPNMGEAFSNSFNQGLERNRENEARNAMAALVQNPENPQALAALAQIDPQTAMQFRQQQLEQHKTLLAEHQDSILKGAEILRQFNPQDQQGYSAALQAAQQAGIDISQVPQEYNPQYVQGVIHIADAMKPGPQDPGPIREYQQALQLNYLPQGTSYEQFLQMKNPGMMSPVNVPYGAQISPGGAAPGVNMPTVATPQDAAKLPPGTKFRLPDGRVGTVPGGAGGNASGGFPQ